MASSAGEHRERRRDLKTPPNLPTRGGKPAFNAGLTDEGNRGILRETNKIINPIALAFGKEIAMVNTAPLRRKRQSMIKLLCNKCNGCASSSSHRFQICGSPKKEYDHCLRSPHKLKFAGTPKNAGGHKPKS